MSSIQESVKAAPFRGLPDPRFFYSNLDRLEVLAALRFGIEARKGLVLFTGDAGTGKTSVLHELTRELNSQVTCLLISDPYMRFTDLLRLILRNLEVGAAPGDDAALIRRCQTALRSRLETSRIICLVFDDAQNLPDETIEALTKIFLGKGFDPDNNLLQIVLAGRPALRKRFFVPPLRALETQVEIECRLQALHVKEIGRYIYHRLRAADLPVEIFNQDAILRIALYTDGRPSLINKLCDRALQVINQSLLNKVTSEVVISAAKDLGYRESRRVGADALPESSDLPKNRDEPVPSQSTTVVAHKFLDRNDDKERQQSRGPAERQAGIIGALLILVLIGLAAASLHRGEMMNYVSKWGFGKGYDGQASPQAKTEADAPAQATSQDLAWPPPGPVDLPAPPSEQPATSDLALAEREKSAELPDSVPTKKPSAGALPSSSRNAAMADNNERLDSPPRNSDQQRRELAKQISKAIENRAILDVQVSVVNGVAYLDGRVATAQQRNAAEQAARGVPEVREIRNRLAIE